VRIVHWAPFAPNRCGLYEAARDMARADYMRDHEVLFIDTGVQVKRGEREEVKIGAMDSRGGWLLETSAPEAALDADLWVCHDGIPDRYPARCQVPMVWTVHGRPLATFRPEQEGIGGSAYSLIKEAASWPRVKAIVTMWDEFRSYWEMLAPGKLRCTIDPPVDSARYRPVGKELELDPERSGRWNLLVCDSWRIDVDVFEVAVACWRAAQRRPGIKVHFWGVEPGKYERPCWQHVYAALREIDAMGELYLMDSRITQAYRTYDALVTPHRIGVRTLAEALCCGLPVVAGAGCRYTPFQANPSDPDAMADAILECLDAEGARAGALEASRAFSLSTFGERMEEIYRDSVSKEATALRAAVA